MTPQKALEAESQSFNHLDDDQFMQLLVESGATLTVGDDEEESE